MLHLLIPERDLWDPVREIFIHVDEVSIDLEHSLAAVSKWEAKWHIPFHDDRKEKTFEQNIDYIRCMCLTENVDPNLFYCITEENVKEIMDYIGDSNTATWFNDTNKRRTGKREIITAEIIYYWMTTYNIPSEYEHWHLNKLMTLLRVCAEKNNPDKKKTKGVDMAAQRRALNAARRQKYKTRG